MAWFLGRPNAQEREAFAGLDRLERTLVRSQTEGRDLRRRLDVCSRAFVSVSRRLTAAERQHDLDQRMLTLCERALLLAVIENCALEASARAATDAVRFLNIEHDQLRARVESMRRAQQRRKK